MPQAISASERGSGPYYLRFDPIHRVLHVTVVVSFLGLVLTGMPIHFSESGWARVLMGLMGGRQAAGVLHRFCAILTFGYFIAHLAFLARTFVKSKDKMALFWGPGSMVPQPGDLRDAVAMFRWFARGGEKPRFDRYSYMEKFDYWAVFWGVAIIGSSGLLLWFPEFFARFLPGWLFNVATIVHGEEAILAAGFIFAIHFFNTHLRSGKFPIDTVAFTGRCTEEYMRDEHPLEYERLLREGRLDELRAAAPSALASRSSLVFGTAAVLTGMGFLALMIWAALH